MSTSYELDAMIQTVAARLDPALVCRRDVDSSLGNARFLPRWQCAGYECRLGDPAPRADFGVHLRRSHATTIDPAILAQAEPGEHSQAAWRRLDSVQSRLGGAVDADSHEPCPPSHWSSTSTARARVWRRRPCSFPSIQGASALRRGAAGRLGFAATSCGACSRHWVWTSGDPAASWRIVSTSCCRESGSRSSASGSRGRWTRSASARLDCR